MDDLKQLDLYDLFGISPTAKVKEIRTAYKKKALTCHPDKNPDNPHAVKLFLQLKKALELLVDDAARASYDKILKAREANKARNDALDSQRKKLKTDLEELERKAFEKQAVELEKERFEQRQKQSFEELRAEVERVCKAKEDRRNENLMSLRRIRIRWKTDKDDASNGGYNEEILTKIFSKYGAIEAIVISSKKKGSALLEFCSSEAARRAQMLEIGNKSNPLTVKVIGGEASESYACMHVQNSKKSDSKQPPLFSFHSSTETRTNSNNESSTNYDDFEAIVFQRMREAQAKKDSLQASNCDIPPE